MSLSFTVAACNAAILVCTMNVLKKLCMHLPYSADWLRVACSRLSDSGEDAKEWERREGERHAKSWEAGKRENGRDREPVIISFTTLFRPLLACEIIIKFGCQTVEISMSWSLSQISCDSILCSTKSNLECKSGSVSNTRLSPFAKLMLVPMNFFSHR